MLDLESLFNLSYGMCIVSSKDEDKFNGCIINTAFQVTPEPPMMAVSVNRENLTWEYMKKSKLFTISILCEDTPMKFIGKFGFKSGRNIDKFENVNYKIGENGTPILLDNTVGFIQAETLKTIDVETHTVFISKITSCETLDKDKIPMTYNYYRDVKHGKTPRTAATYISKKSADK
jgi:ferric-chelate reductase [NAD(P)H]